MFQPAVGRWLSKDPAKYVDGANVYLYSGNMPNFKLDPSGLLQIVLAYHNSHVFRQSRIFGRITSPPVNWVCKDCQPGFRFDQVQGSTPGIIVQAIGQLAGATAAGLWSQPADAGDGSFYEGSAGVVSEILLSSQLSDACNTVANGYSGFGIDWAGTVYVSAM